MSTALWLVPLLLGVFVLAVHAGIMTFARMGKGFSLVMGIPHPDESKPEGTLLWIPVVLKFHHRLGRFLAKVYRHTIECVTLGYRKMARVLVNDFDIGGPTVAHEVGGHGWQNSRYGDHEFGFYYLRAIWKGIKSWAEVEARKYEAKWGHVFPDFILQANGSLYYRPRPGSPVRVFYLSEWKPEWGDLDSQWGHPEVSVVGPPPDAVSASFPR